MTETDIEALAKSVEKLAPRTRLARYKELAAEALSQAESSHEQTTRRAYFRVATAWRALAADLERDLVRRRA